MVSLFSDEGEEEVDDDKDNNLDEDFSLCFGAADKIGKHVYKLIIWSETLLCWALMPSRSDM